jgi:hypothetical protein
MSDREQVRLRQDQVLWRRVEGAVVALDMGSYHYLTVNDAGAVLWDALHDGSTRPALVDRLVSEFGIAPERAGADVDAFLADLRSRGLLEP